MAHFLNECLISPTIILAAASPASCHKTVILAAVTQRLPRLWLFNPSLTLELWTPYCTLQTTVLHVQYIMAWAIQVSGVGNSGSSVRAMRFTVAEGVGITRWWCGACVGRDTAGPVVESASGVGVGSARLRRQ